MHAFAQTDDDVLPHPRLDVKPVLDRALGGNRDIVERQIARHLRLSAESWSSHFGGILSRVLSCRAFVSRDG
jgi:hypothetical protein